MTFSTNSNELNKHKYFRLNFNIQKMKEKIITFLLLVGFSYQQRTANNTETNQTAIGVVIEEQP